MNTAGGLSGLVRSFQLALVVEGLRPSTVRHYVSDTRRFVNRTNNQSPRKVTAGHVREFILEYQKTHAPKTVREMQLALRKFFRFLVAEGEIARDPTASIKLMPFRVTPQPTYSESEVRQLLLVCDSKTRTGARDRAIITVLYDTAVREGELISMGLPDWERRRVRVSGKTGVRDVPLGLTALQRRAPAQLTRIPATGAGSDRAAPGGRGCTNIASGSVHGGRSRPLAGGGRRGRRGDRVT